MSRHTRCREAPRRVRSARGVAPARQSPKRTISGSTDAHRHCDAEPFQQSRISLHRRARGDLCGARSMTSTPPVETNTTWTPVRSKRRTRPEAHTRYLGARSSGERRQASGAKRVGARACAAHVHPSRLSLARRTTDRATPLGNGRAQTHDETQRPPWFMSHYTLVSRRQMTPYCFLSRMSRSQSDLSHSSRKNSLSASIERRVTRA